MKTTTTTSENDLLDRAQDAVATLSAHIDSLPQEGDLATPTERERVYVQRSTSISLRSGVVSALQSYKEFKPRLETLRLWADTLRACQIEFERALTTLEDLPTSEQDRMRRDIDNLTESLRIIVNGPSNIGGGEITTPILYTWLESHGVRADHGQMFAGRGGLRRTQERIDALQAERAAVGKDVEARLAQVHAATPSPLVTTTI
jgi:hypothetical protein